MSVKEFNTFGSQCAPLCATITAPTLGGSSSQWCSGGGSSSVQSSCGQSGAAAGPAPLSMVCNHTRHRAPVYACFLTLRRSRSDRPPQMPNRSSCASAYSRHSERTSQERQTFFASRVDPPFSGKKASGSVWAHNPRSCHMSSSSVTSSKPTSNDMYVITPPSYAIRQDQSRKTFAVRRVGARLGSFDLSGGHHVGMTDAADLLAEWPDPSRPFVTYYDAASGERVELSGTTTRNWVMKAANLLVEEADAEVGIRVMPTMPSHWMRIVWLLATWAVGGIVVDQKGD